MSATPSADQMVDILHETMVAPVRCDGPDLSARQFSAFLTCYLREGDHTVRSLAAELNVSKTAITCVLDRPGEFEFARRKVNPLDRRSVLVQSDQRCWDTSSDHDVRFQRLLAESGQAGIHP